MFHILLTVKIVHSFLEWSCSQRDTDKTNQLNRITSSYTL